MKYKTLMLIKAVVSLTFGFLMLVFPSQLFTIMGASLGAAGLFAARAYGASLAGNMMLTWYARDAEKSTARKAIILDLFIYDAIGLVVALYNVLNGTLNWLGWGIVAIYLVFTIGFGSFWFAERADA